MIGLWRRGRRLRVAAVSLVLLLAGLVVTTVSLAGYQRVHPYDIDVAFYDPWPIPHFGAFFGGVMGYGQRYIPGGCPGIESWDWWNYFYNTLLIPKTWLLFTPPLEPHWQEANYDAMLCYGGDCPN
jgi:hypothetical protein